MMRIVGFIPYIIIIIGIYLLFRQHISYLIRDIAFTLKKRNKQKDKVSSHFNLLFSAVYGQKKAKRNLMIYIIVSIALLIFCSVIFISSIGIMLGLTLSALITLLPYFYVRSKLGGIRLDASYEAEVLISEIINQYKICGGNIYETIDETIANLTEKEPISKRELFKLSMKLKTYQTDSQLKSILNEMVYAINTEWSKILTNNIYNAVAENTNIINGLEDLLTECKKINEWLEKSKKSNFEAMGMIKFGGPLFFIAFLYMLHSAMDYSLSEIASYQLGTTVGVIVLAILIIVFFVNFIVANVMKKQKYDI